MTNRKVARQALNMALGRRNEGFIALMFPFKLDEVEVAAGVAIWVVAADLRTPFINRTAPFALVEEHAHRFVNGILSMP